MARGKKVEITPRYDYMFDAYVTTAKIAFSEYKNAMIRYLDSMWIGSDGSLNILGMKHLNNLIVEKRAAYEKAMQEMNAFKTLYGDKIEELKRSKEVEE